MVECIHPGHEVLHTKGGDPQGQPRQRADPQEHPHTDPWAFKLMSTEDWLSPRRNNRCGGHGGTAQEFQHSQEGSESRSA